MSKQNTAIYQLFFNTSLLQSSDSGDFGAESVETLINAFIAAVDLLDIVNDARTLSRHGGYQHRYAGPDIGRMHMIGS